MNLQLMYKTIERKAIFFVAAEEIEKLTDAEKQELNTFCDRHYLKIEHPSPVMCVIKKYLEALMSV
jgi:hypothetical protein